MNLAARLLGNKVNIRNLQDSLQQMFFPQENETYWNFPRGWLTILGMDKAIPFFFFTFVPCILILSKSFIYQLMHNRVALKEY